MGFSRECVLADLMPANRIYEVIRRLAIVNCSATYEAHLDRTHADWDVVFMPGERIILLDSPRERGVLVYLETIRGSGELVGIWEPWDVIVRSFREFK